MPAPDTRPHPHPHPGVPVPTEPVPTPAATTAPPITARIPVPGARTLGRRPFAATASRRGVLLGGLAAGLAACGHGSSASAGASGPAAAAVDLSTVTLAVGDQKGGSIQSLLTAAGLYTDLPYRVEWSTFTSGPPILEAINAGAIDVGGVGNTPPIFSAAAKASIRIIAASQQARASNSVLVPKNSTVTGFAGLKGKKIAVAQASSAHGQVLLELAKHGLAVSDVSLEFLQPADGLAAFSQGSVDAWAVWEPYVSQGEQGHGGRIVAPGSDGSANGYTFTISSPKALADPGKSAALADYVSRVSRAYRWSSTHKPAWAAIFASQTGLTEAVSLSAITHQDQRPVLLTSAVAASEQELADAFVAAGVIPEQVTFASYVDNRFNPRIQPYV